MDVADIAAGPASPWSRLRSLAPLASDGGGGGARFPLVSQSERGIDIGGAAEMT